MNWAFVDYENVRSLESINLAAYQRVFVFCGPQNKSVKFDELPASGICRVDLITVPTSSKNNVDFHLAFHLGVEHSQASADINFHVISNDKGYQGLINHLELLGRSCKLVEPNVAKKATARKTSSRKATSKTTADMALSVQKESVQKASGQKASGQNGAGQNGSGQKSQTPENQTPEKQAQKKPEQRPAERGNAGGKTAASKSGTNKPSAGKAATSKSAEKKAVTGTAARSAKAKTVTKIKIKASSAAALSDAARKLFAQLQITGGNRPKTKARVLSWLKSHVKSLHVHPEPSPDSIFEEWKAAGMLSLSGSTVRYPDA